MVMTGLLPSSYRRAFTEILSEQSYSRFRPTRYPVFARNLRSPFWPRAAPLRRPSIEAHCSTIHVDSAIVLLYARRDLRPVCNLEVSFHETSSVAMVEFLRASGPAIVTVTQGTAQRLTDLTEAGRGRYMKFLKVQPGILRWSSPDSPAVRHPLDLRGMRLRHIDHPTDLLAVRDFQSFLISRNVDPSHVGLEVTPPGSHVPEYRDEYKKGELSLTNTFMALWAMKGSSPAIVPGWKSIERRYLFVNGALRDLVDKKGFSLALFLQDYLAERFENLREVRQGFVDDFHFMGGASYMRAGGLYLGVL
jgi:hypothetical protein